ncbi:beta-L-arabinofuranosidase domain-containing protein [Anaeromassilibacillus senegalensis]|uniref:beta-L-arabinofuranosidase domain-containing protein n=1 Tax=Anaeromassilibacillus senegalensis TaxID=1673717 RepID=UPI000680EA64|nr:beta-L-arabinofuranosidase domain-containing protein [Anaeromassilibacillus senegalensis]
MKRQLLAGLLSAAVLLSGVPTAFAAGSAAGAAEEPAKSIDFTHVKITDDFWGARQKQFICKVIPTGIANVEKGGGGIPNIINAAKMHRGEEHGAFQGAFYVDSDVHKVLESMCYALQIDPMGDQEVIDGQQVIRDKLEEWIPYYVDAQEENGYFDTYFILGANGNTPKWWDFNLHELYCAGHFYEAAIAHYRATNGQDTRLFDMAIKNADYVNSLFGEGKWKQVPGHQEIELALIKLANLCEEIGGEYAAKAPEYIKLAEFFLDTRGDFEDRHGTNHNASYDQDHIPVKDQKEATGHAVRAAYMYTAMADVNLLEQDGRYDEALLALWDDIENKKTYVTGGVGSNPANEGYGAAYDLPNDTAYCETCANIANVMFNQRMNLLYGESKYADIVERGLYNSIISCVDFDGETFFYGNPMSSNGNKHRSQWFGTACCPPNLMRTVEALGGYIYTQQGDTITQNLYIGNEANLQTSGGAVLLRTETEMPWQGETAITVEVDQPTAFTYRLRVPEWATDGNTVSLNGEPISAEPDEQGYITLSRTWNDGDSIDLNFPMETKRAYSDPRVKANEGAVAVKRGPIVYAAEAVDNEYPISKYILPTDATFSTKWVENLEDEKFNREVVYPEYVEANLTEDFADAEAANASWTRVGDAGKIDISGGKVSVQKSTNNKLTTGDEAWSDLVMEMQVTLGEDGTESGNAGMLIRSTQEGSGPDNYHGYYFGIGLEGTEYGKADGGWTRLGKKTHDIQLGVPYTLKVIAYQNKFLFFVNGEKVGSFDDLDHQTGKVGLRGYNRAYEVDNVVVRPLTDEEIALTEMPSEDHYGVKPAMQVVAHTKAKVQDEAVDADLVMTPYYAWDNRQSGAMAIYLPEEFKEIPLEGYAKASASYVYQNDSIEALNDGTDARWTSWSGPLNPWVQYDFDEPVTLWGCDVKWYDDNGGVKVPDGLEIVYWNGEAFVPVTPTKEYNSFNKNQYNNYGFTPVVTDKIRMNIKNDVKKVASGIMEWKVQGQLGAVDFGQVSLASVQYGHKPYATEYNTLNEADFTPVTANKFRVLMEGQRSVGMKEFRLQKEDGTYAEQDAAVSASYTCEEWSTLKAVNDGKGWDTSAEVGTGSTWSTYPEAGTQWVEYAFEEPITVKQAEICWYRAWDDGVIAPDSWKIQYEKDGEWVDVDHAAFDLDFDKAVMEYTVKMPKLSAVPVVTAEADASYAAVAIRQAETFPGSAQITVSVPGYPDSEKTYTIHFVEQTEQLPQLLNVQWNPNQANVEIAGETDVILDGNGIYGAKVVPGTKLTFTFTPANGPFASAKLNGENIPFEADGFTYTYTMPNDKAVLRFTFTSVNKSVLETLLEKANEVTDKQLAGLVESVSKRFVAARSNAKAIYENDSATQEEVNEAWKELLDAMHHLSFEAGTKEQLEYWLDYAAMLDLNNFTPKSLEGYAEALAYAEEIYNDEGETLKAEVEKAANNLHDAIMRLEFKADTETLALFVKQAQEIDLDEYLDGPEKDAFEEVLPQAEALLADGNATQKQVDEMTDKLFDALAGLRVTPDREALKDLLEESEALNPADYTEASYAILRAALNLAWDTCNDENATPKDIAVRYATVEKARAGLALADKPEEPEKPGNKPSHKPSNSGGKKPVGNTSGTGTAVAVPNPLINAVQNVMGQKSVRSDTTANFTLKRGNAYCFKMTVVNGSNAAPNFTVGNGSVLKTQFVAKIGNDYYYRVWATGTPGQSTGVYTTMAGENPQQHCVVTIS